MVESFFLSITIIVFLETFWRFPQTRGVKDRAQLNVKDYEVDNDVWLAFFLDMLAAYKFLTTLSSICMYLLLRQNAYETNIVILSTNKERSDFYSACFNTNKHTHTHI